MILNQLVIKKTNIRYVGFWFVYQRVGGKAKGAFNFINIFPLITVKLVIITGNAIIFT
jgi:hypothetical protein